MTPSIQLRRACYLLLIVVIYAMPFALGQRATIKQSVVAHALLLKSRPVTTLSTGDHPASGTWTVTGSLNTARVQHTATLLPNGRVLVAAGYEGLSFTPSNVLSTAELYDPATGACTVTGSLN
jgi:Galactose oxidase, central domain